MSSNRVCTTNWLPRGYRVAVLRHPMPYGDLDAANVTIEELEEYEPYVRMGVPVFAGVDYARILAHAEKEAQVVLWDGGKNDFPFIRPDLHIVVVDPLRAGHEVAYHPGETNLRMADAYVISKADSPTPEQLAEVKRNIRAANPKAPIAVAQLTLTVQPEGSIKGKRVVIVGDGPTLTHGGLGFGAGTLAARRFRAAKVVNPRPYAVGELRATFKAFPHLQHEIPAMGYSPHQIASLEATLEATPADIVIDATPVELSRLVKIAKPILNVEYRFEERGTVLARLLERFERGWLISR
ncbi:MAG: hypothetical protein FJ312_09445 [SAR202 cluster bacterium]|nr:hypothetical protein [SAR202 cluster bacterium]